MFLIFEVFAVCFSLVLVCFSAVGLLGGGGGGRGKGRGGEDDRPWVAEEHQNVEQEVALGKAKNRASTRSQTRWRACERPRTSARQLRADTSNT